MASVNDSGSFERIRKAASFVAVAVFAASFTALLVLSATSYWRPDNEWLGSLDVAWRVSGLIAVVLGVIPPVRRFLQQVVGWLSPDRDS
jgi:cytochrome c oxidase assembly factor CtaG